MNEPSQMIVRLIAIEIKGGVDHARERGVVCDYPILFEIDGQFYSFATVIAECSSRQTEQNALPLD